jgi:PASTA domain
MGENEGVLNWATNLLVADTSFTAPLIPPYYDLWYTLQAITVYGEKQLSNSINVQYPVQPPPPVTVPDVIGMVYADAVTKLQADGLQVEETSVIGIFNTSDYKVTGQSPAGGTQVSNGSLVNLTIEAIASSTTGTYDLALEHESPSAISYSAPAIPAAGQLGGVPADATITGVTGLSSATFSLAHGGPGSHYVPLGANVSTTAFNGQKVTVGSWSAEYSGAIAQAPPILKVAIAWKG